MTEILDLDTGATHAIEGDNWDVPEEVERLTGVTHYCAFYQSEAGVQNAGILWFHRRKDNPAKSCVGSASFKGRDPKGIWTLVAENPLTVTASLHCLDCGRHGHITDGRWKEC